MENAQNGNLIDSTLIRWILKAVQEGNLEQIKATFLKYNPDINYLRDPANSQTPYFFAAWIPNDNTALPVFKYLKEIGINPTLKDIYLQTSLYYTCREGKWLCTKFLVEELNLSPNDIDIYGQNPLYYAAREGQMEIMKYMIEKGGNINLIDKYGQTCIFYSIRWNHADVTRLLISKGANWTIEDDKKMTVTTFAEKYVNDEILEWWIESGAPKPSAWTASRMEKDKKHKKNNSIKQISSSYNISENNKDNSSVISKQEITVEEIQKPRAYIWVKICDNGNKVQWTEEEVAQFYLENERIAKLWSDKEERNKLVNEAGPQWQYIDSWEKIGKKWMNLWWKHKGAEWFHRPVDPVKLNIRDYFDYIKHPMDFSTIKKKLWNGLYSNCKEFISDIEWTFNNCYLYNGDYSHVGVMCTNVKKEYLRLYKLWDIEKFV